MSDFEQTAFPDARPSKTWGTSGRWLAPLNGLRAFEAAARRGSFAAAGHELNVTQAAVSRMVRLLEERLGFRLFERRANALELTWQGRTLQPGLTAAFDTVANLVEQVATLSAVPVLTVGVGPSFAVRWLIPRTSISSIASDWFAAV